MSLSIVHSRALLGLEARPVCVEVHLANGLPSFTLVGLAETEVKEARERVRSAIQNTGLEFPSNNASLSIWHQPTCPKTRAALTCRSRWASWQPVARSMCGKWMATNLQVSCRWAVTCARYAERWP